LIFYFYEVNISNNILHLCISALSYFYNIFIKYVKDIDLISNMVIHREWILMHVCTVCDKRVDKLCLLGPRLSFVTMNAKLVTMPVYRSQ